MNLHRDALPRLSLSILLLALALAACGGGASAASSQAAGASSAAQEPQRAQDARTFTVDAAGLRFDALPGAPDADRWWGVLDGAGYDIEVPKAWNGMLVMVTHGYVGTGSALVLYRPEIRRHLLALGYAWAASTYSRNNYDVRAAIEDTNALALAFGDIARRNGRALAAPAKIYVMGGSMGGHVAAAAVDEETIETANHPVRYDGAVAMCGVLGDTALYDYFAAYQLAALQEAGMPATRWPLPEWPAIAAQVRDKLFASFPTAPGIPAVPSAQGQRLKTIVRNLTGGARPMFDEAYAGPLQATLWSTFAQDGKMVGIVNDSVVSTRDIVYQLDDDPALTSEERQYNAAIYRAQAAPDANRLRRDGLRRVPKANARIRVPLVTIHTLGDLYVPFSMEQMYKRRADAAGTSGMLVQRAIRGVKHCDFTIAEMEAAFDAMVKWEQQGVKPAGDDVLTPSVLADPQYGCAFTDNTPSPEDSLALLQARAALPACRRR